MRERSCIGDYCNDRINVCMSDYNFWRVHIEDEQAVGDSHSFLSTNYLQVMDDGLVEIGVDSLSTINILLI